MPHPTRRAAIFTLADARGNNPHGTRETADHEGRRRNAGRYETVGDLDRALDRKTRPPRLIAPQLGDVAPTTPAPPPEPGNILGALLLVAVGAAIAYVATRGEKHEEDDEPLRENPALPSRPPSPVVVVTASAPTPAPAPVVVMQAPVKVPKRRRTVVVPVVVVTEPATGTPAP